MQISELAQQASVSVHALRHYERLGLIHPDRRANGYRDYPARMRREVVFIAMSRQLGFSLPQIALRLDEYRAGTLGIDDMVQALQARVDAIDQQIAALQSQKSTVQAHQAWLRGQLLKKQRSKTQGRQTPSGAATASTKPWPRVRAPSARKP
ncbi:DNA-binding transcriptional MerR regulator [Acidovorax delafieldii]|uniref:DNA-binding transcriptional MerR regulator n=1 Tax=Acidovorax delafieldii TaxID=47920 RepID=A0A561XU48_ACIDE|nr:MerR family DNA-binding transcriptional regulator [Acidovorax delafieldii]TWG39637.1 DNA-binding transcriptional MerR regulator [Acidovorax delafieldii]|eukprot:gene27784-35851_t